MGDEEEHDLNSFMYQTVGHTAVPLYEQALGIPLYRQEIVGSAVQRGMSYSHSTTSNAEANLEIEDGEEEDETESLIPLLRRIMKEHPETNALSTGAILSTYQRTRIESVALRLGLTPLSYLWNYPALPPATQISLLQDMQAVGLDARIVKVASGGLDESFLWANVADAVTTWRVEKAMRRFGMDGDGAVLGEGGEFETLVINGPTSLFKGRIEVREKDRRLVREGGGSAWLRILEARVVMKTAEFPEEMKCRIPDMLEGKFQSILDSLIDDSGSSKLPAVTLPAYPSVPGCSFQTSNILKSASSSTYWTIFAPSSDPTSSIADETLQIVTEIRKRLAQSSLQPTSITSTLILLRSIDDFTTINSVSPSPTPSIQLTPHQIYTKLFPHPNPPSRITISLGPLLPPNTNIAIHLKLTTPQASRLPQSRKALHIQSRSYWAPANIGPYSQAIATPIPSLPSSHDQDQEQGQIWTVNVAGQIPLIPSSMTLPVPKTGDGDGFKLQAVLALQHLWRIGREMDVRWWTNAVAYLPRTPAHEIEDKVGVAVRAWVAAHDRGGGDDEEGVEEGRDLWEERYYAEMQNHGGFKKESVLPDWEIVECNKGREVEAPPMWVCEVEGLPRRSEIEWHAQLGIVGEKVKVSF